MNKEVKTKIYASLAVLLLNCICTACVYIFSIETTVLKVVSSFVTVLVVSAAVWLFPLRFYITALIFVFFSSSLGSCVNLYSHIEMYDVIIHYLSGILLFSGGQIIVEYLCNKRCFIADRLAIGLFSLFFSCACAAFWEIFEFYCDVLVGAGMQGTKRNTMVDIIAGVLGAFTGVVLYFFRTSRSKEGN